MTNTHRQGNNIFSRQVLGWYKIHKRTFPWRGNPDPYAIWVAEIMLQQTRAETVIPYFERWRQKFPSIVALAQASLQEVLCAWEGLGYYGRARSLHQAARIVMDEYHGQLPEEAQLLRKLPGVGRYTAAAIASIAFGKDEPTLDGNIRRVLARYFNVTDEIHSGAAERVFWQLVGQNLPRGQAGNYNQALMDLGALICTPRLAACYACPLADACQAYALGLQEERPVHRPRLGIPHYTVTAAVIQHGGLVLIARRPITGLLGGLWEFPGGKLQDGEDLPACLRRELHEELGVEIEVGSQLGVYQHAYTHFKVTVYTFQCTLVAGVPRPIQESDVCWVAPAELTKYPMGKVDRQIAQKIISSGEP